VCFIFTRKILGFYISEVNSKDQYQAFWGVLIDLIIVHDWVLGLDYQSI